MKKILLISSLLFVFLFSCYAVASAKTVSSYVTDDSIIVTATESDGTKEVKSVRIHDYNDRDYFGIRELADICQADIEWIPETKSIKATTGDANILFQYSSNEIFYNGTKFDFGTPVFIFEGVSYAPIEIYKAFTGEFDSNETVTENSETISPKTNNSLLMVEEGIESDRVTFYTEPENIVRHFRLSNPERIVIDIRADNFDGNVPTGQTFSKIRFSTNSGGVIRFVFDLNEDFDYRLNANGNSFIVDISKTGAFINSESRIEFRNNSVIINTVNWEGYKISRTSDPYTINAEIPDRITDKLIEISGDGNLVERITAEPSDFGTLIKIYTTDQCAFELEKLQENFIVGIYEPVVKNIIYHNHEGIPYIQIIDYDNPDNMKVDYRNDGTYITFNDNQNIYTKGQIYINDGTVKNIYVSKNGDNVTIRIQAANSLYTSPQVKEGDTAIYLNENDLSGRLVVISAGHGGRDPGAIAGDVYEADINLSIAKKLNVILTSMGIDTLMIREDDTYFSLDERVEIANNNNAALFISIHSNALDDPEFSGLMTLVHSGSLNYDRINGRTAGEIIHEYLIDGTGAVDRGLRYRDQIIVLRETAMPAVEIESGFLTNATELSKLIDDTYQMTIAEAAAEGIADVLKYIN